MDWYKFLNRERLPQSSDSSLVQLRQASILITGAGGSIGAALAQRFAALKPRHLVLLETSEQSLYRLESQLADASLLAGVSLYLGRVGDEALLDDIFSTYKPTIVFHAAAYKHVPLLESQHLAAIENNVFSTLSLVECAERHRSVSDIRSTSDSRIVLLSTDKAADPQSILGATKRIAELIVTARQGVVLRLANVLGSEGSVVGLFLDQIIHRAPLTITHPDAERFFMTCDEAVDLLLSAAVHAENGNLLAPNLTAAHKITALAEHLIAAYCEDHTPPVIFTGLRAGEKLRDTFWSTNQSINQGLTTDEQQPTSLIDSGCISIMDEPNQAEQWHDDLYRLRLAIAKRDTNEAIKIVCKLVPSYVPTAVVRDAAYGTLGAAKS